ncbi:MAG: PAS domain S-box protein [Chitinophagaceae bacterium]
MQKDLHHIKSLQKLNRVYAVSSHINAAVLKMKDKKLLLKAICDAIIEHGKFKMVWVGFTNHLTHQIEPYVWSGEENGYLSTGKVYALDITEGKGPTGTAVRTGKIVACQNFETDVMMRPWRTAALERGYLSSLCIPIIINKQIEGAFSIYSGEANHFDSDEEIELLQNAVDNISYGLEMIALVNDNEVAKNHIDKLSEVIAQSHTSMVIANEKGLVEYVNPAFTRVSGYTIEEIKGKNPREILGYELQEPESYISLVNSNNGKNWEGIKQNRKKDGTIFWEHIVISTIQNQDGLVTNYVAIKEDITQKVATEKELLEHKQRLETLTEISQQWIYQTDATGLYTYTNNSVIHLLGYHPSEIIGKKYYYDFFDIDFLPHINEVKEQYNKATFFKNFENCLTHKNGSKVFVLTSANPLFDDKGKFCGYYGVDIDITAQKETELKLKASEAKYRTIYNNIQDIYFKIDEAGVITEMSPSIEKNSLYQLHELLGKPIADFYFFPSQRERFLERIKLQQKVTDYEIIIRNKDGTPIYTSLNAQFYKNKNDSIKGIEGTIRNITERKVFESSLQLKEQNYSQILNSLLDALIIFDAENEQIVDCNEAAYIKFGFNSRNEMLQTTLTSIVSQPNNITLAKYIQQLNNISNNELITTECLLKGKRQDAFWGEVFMRKTIINGFERVLMIIHDITKRKAHEDAIVRTQQQLVNAQKMAHLGSWQIDIATWEISGSEEFFNIYGLPNIGKRPLQEIRNCVLPEYQAIMQQTLDNLINYNKAYEIEYCIQKADNGEKRYIQSKAHLVTNNEGKPWYVEGVLQDVTNAVLAQASLRKLSRAVEQSSASIVITDTKGVIEYVNPAFTNVSGFTASEVLGANPRVLKSSNTPIEVYKELWQTISHGETWFGILQNRKKNGDLYWESATISPVMNEKGTVTNYIAIKEDITERVKAEDERKLLLEELTRNNAELKQFSYITTHNLRAPLTNLLSIVNLIEPQNINDEETMVLMEAMKQSTLSLNETLNDLINILILKDKSNTDKGVLSFNDTFKKVKRSIEELLLTCTIQTNFTAAPTVLFSKNYLESILLNLLTNAVKYAHPERKTVINIFTQIVNDKIQLVIEDNGLGMDMNIVKDKIFGLYQRFHNNSNGKGIGLYLVHSQIIASGGNIEVDSQPNIGTKFTITF